MKKLLVGALVGGLLVFIWQTVSWTVLGLHEKEYQHTPKQDSIISYLSSQFSADGQYLIPREAPGSSMEDMQKVADKMKGKPWAIVSYHQSYNTDMMMNILRGLITSILSVFLVCWILAKNSSPTFGSTFLATVFIGIVGYLFIPYSAHIWYATPDATTNLVDVLLSWGLCGLWLGWWLPRK